MVSWLLHDPSPYHFGVTGPKLEPIYCRAFGELPPRVNPTASGLPQELQACQSDSTDVDCWDKPSHWAAAAIGFLPLSLLVFAVAFQHQQQNFVQAKELHAHYGKLLENKCLGNVAAPPEWRQPVR